MRQVSVGYGEQSAQLREIRMNDPLGQGRHSFTAQQQTLRRLDAAFRAFFRRVTADKHKVGYPRFKPHQRFDQVQFVAGDGARWQPADGGRWAQVTFQAVGQLKVKQHRPERTKAGSGNRARLGRMLVREWRKVRNQRRDFHHKTARALVDSYDVLALENLRIGNLTASARGTLEEPGRNVAQKAGLNRSILDAGWGQFTSILVAKAESAGRRVIRVEPGYTSLDCHACGSRCSRPRQAIVVCPKCGEQVADLNAACNIATRAGLGSGQAHVA